MALLVVFHLQLRCSLSTPFTTEQASDATIIPGILGVNQNETAYKNTWDSIPGCFSIEIVIWKKCEPIESSNPIFSGTCHNLICFLFVCIQWIGFRQNLQETILIICTIKYRFFLLDFPQKLEPITEFLNVCWSNFVVQIWFPPTVNKGLARFLVRVPKIPARVAPNTPGTTGLNWPIYTYEYVYI